MGPGPAPFLDSNHVPVQCPRGCPTFVTSTCMLSVQTIQSTFGPAVGISGRTVSGVRSEHVVKDSVPRPG